MPLSLSNGDFTPHVRWMASTSSWKMSTEDEPKNVTWKHAIFDLAGIKTGWAVFEKDEPPEWKMDPSPAQRAPRPDKDREWKRGFKLNIFSDSVFGGIREFATTATGASMGIQQLYKQFEAESSQHPGKVPVVQFAGATPARVGKGNTNVPNLAIVKWVDRPNGLPLDQPLQPIFQAAAPQVTKPVAAPQVNQPLESALAVPGKTDEFGLPLDDTLPDDNINF